MPVIQADELRQWRRREPFQPFRVVSTDGEIFEIRDPTNILVGDDVVLVPFRTNPASLFGDYSVYLELDQILRVEPSQSAQTIPGGGGA
jgi:hypothetical protein